MTPCSLAGLHLAAETGIQQDLSACHYQPLAECLSPGALGCLEKMTFSLLVMSAVRAASETCSSESCSPYSEVWRPKARLGDTLNSHMQTMTMEAQDQVVPLKISLTPRGKRKICLNEEYHITRRRTGIQVGPAATLCFAAMDRQSPRFLSSELVAGNIHRGPACSRNPCLIPKC